MPEKREGEPGKPGRKDLDAGWIKRNGETHCGCRNHADADRKSKLARRFHAADASARGSQAVHRLPGNGNNSPEVRADSISGPEAIEERLRERGLTSRIHRKGRRGKSLSGRCKQGNRARFKARARAGHVFGVRANGMGVAHRARHRHDAGHGQNRDEELGLQ